MAVADLFVITVFKERKKKKPKFIGKVTMADFPTDDEIGQIIKDLKGDEAKIERIYRLLPFE